MPVHIMNPSWDGGKADVCKVWQITEWGTTTAYCLFSRPFHAGLIDIQGRAAFYRWNKLLWELSEDVMYSSQHYIWTWQRRNKTLDCGNTHQRSRRARLLTVHIRSGQHCSLFWLQTAHLHIKTLPDWQVKWLLVLKCNLGGRGVWNQWCRNNRPVWIKLI